MPFFWFSHWLQNLIWMSKILYSRLTKKCTLAFTSLVWEWRVKDSLINKQEASSLCSRCTTAFHGSQSFNFLKLPFSRTTFHSTGLIVWSGCRSRSVQNRYWRARKMMWKRQFLLLRHAGPTRWTGLLMFRAVLHSFQLSRNRVIGPCGRQEGEGGSLSSSKIVPLAWDRTWRHDAWYFLIGSSRIPSAYFCASERKNL